MRNEPTQTKAARRAEQNEVFFAVNRHTKTACILTGFRYWEEVQGAFRCGIRLPDDSSANGIGRCKSAEDFAKRAAKSKFTVLIETPTTDDDEGMASHEHSDLISSEGAREIACLESDLSIASDIIAKLYAKHEDLFTPIPNPSFKKEKMLLGSGAYGKWRVTDESRPILSRELARNMSEEHADLFIAALNQSA